MMLFTHSWEDKGVRTFPKGICPKVIVIARLEFELAYYDSAVQRFNQLSVYLAHSFLENTCNLVLLHMEY